MLRNSAVNGVIIEFVTIFREERISIKCRMLFFWSVLTTLALTRECDLGPFERNHSVDLEPGKCEAVSVLEEFPDFYREIVIESTNGENLLYLTLSC